MRAIFFILAFFLLSGVHNAEALVGSTDGPGPTSRHTVMVLKKQKAGSSFCSGVLIAPQVVLTAAHCVHRAAGVAIYVPGDGTPKLIEASTVTMHPGYVPDAIRTRKRSIDLALVRTSGTLPGFLSPVAIDSQSRYKDGDALMIAGFGLQREGVENSAGQLRSARIIVREPLSSILLWAKPARKGIGGACTGDSGGPVFSADATRLVAITTWSRGTGKRRCGELTQGVLVAPQRNWIDATLAKWGAR